jgi:hypothetical protein
MRWFPLKNSKRVVIDPAVAFGQPTIDPEGVPTIVLARRFAVRPDERVARRDLVSRKRPETYLCRTLAINV